MARLKKTAKQAAAEKKAIKQAANAKRAALLAAGGAVKTAPAEPETARKVGLRHGRVVLYQVRTGDMARDGFRFYRSVNGVWLTKCVPAKYLKKQNSES